MLQMKTFLLYLKRFLARVRSKTGMEEVLDYKSDFPFFVAIVKYPMLPENKIFMG